MRRPPTEHVPLPLPSTWPLDPDAPFTTDSAYSAGISKRQLRHLTRTGALRRLVRGLYVSAHVPDDLHLRATALGLVVPPGCFVADRTAAWLHGAEMALAPGDHLRTPPVTIVNHTGDGRIENQIARGGERGLLPKDLTYVNGIFVTTPLRTALDLGRVRNPDLALAAIDQLLALGCFSKEELLAEIERFRGHRWVTTLRFVAPLGDGRAQSPGESALRLRWLDTDLPRPELQVPILGDDGTVLYYLDLGVPEEHFGAEYDGEEFHTEDEDREHDDRRRTWIREHRSYWIEVFDKDNVYGPRQDADVRLRRAWADHLRGR